jgi:hypothetical protein
MKIRVKTTLSLPTGIFAKDAIIEGKKDEIDEFLLKEIEMKSGTVEVLEDDEEVEARPVLDNNDRGNKDSDAKEDVTTNTPNLIEEVVEVKEEVKEDPVPTKKPAAKKKTIHKKR